MRLEYVRTTSAVLLKQSLSDSIQDLYIESFGNAFMPPNHLTAQTDCTQKLT